MVIAILTYNKYCDICNEFTKHKEEQHHYPEKKTIIKCNECGRLTTFNTGVTK